MRKAYKKNLQTSLCQPGAFIKQWIRFCQRQLVNEFQAHVHEILNFLTELFDDGAGYSALNTARSPLSIFVTVKFSAHCSVGQHPLVKQFLKGAFSLRPSLPKCNVTWDANILLNLLKSWSPAKFLSLKKLTLKSVTLLTLLTGRRLQTLHLLHVRN